jgi:hypothetical protein
MMDRHNNNANLGGPDLTSMKIPWDPYAYSMV